MHLLDIFNSLILANCQTVGGFSPFFFLCYLLPTFTSIITVDEKIMKIIYYRSKYLLTPLLYKG